MSEQVKVNPVAEPGEQRTFVICGCKGKIVKSEDGNAHFELECKTKEDRALLAAIFEEEVILRVNPKLILEDTPPPVVATPVTES